MFFKSIVALAVAASSVLAQISTPPALVECQPVQLSWTATTSPYFLSVIPGGQSSAAALVDLGQQTGTSYTWTVNLASGTSVTLKLVDSNGNNYYSSPLTIQAGSSSSCLTSSAAAGSTAAAASGASSAASSAASTTGAAAVTSAAATSAVSSASAATTKASSAASAASSGASGASSKASSAVSGASSAASSAAAATSTSAAGKTIVGSFGAMLLGAIGIIMV